MIQFLFGALAGAFICLIILQFATQKSITISVIKDRAEDPGRYRNMQLAYFACVLAAITLALIVPNL